MFSAVTSRGSALHNPQPMALRHSNALHLTDKDKVWCVYSFPDNERVACACDGGGVVIWNFKTNAQVLCSPQTNTTAVAVSPDGNMVVIGNHNSGIDIWDARTGKRVAGPWMQSGGRVLSVDWSPLGDRIASCSEGGNLAILFNTPSEQSSGEVTLTWEYHQIQTHGVAPRTIAYHPMGPKFATSGRNSTINVWDDTSNEGNVVETLDNHDEIVSSIAWTKDGSSLISGSINGIVQVMRIGQQGVVHILHHDGMDHQAINYIAVSAHVFATAFADTIFLWDLKTHERLDVLFRLPLVDNRPDEAHCVAITADEKTMIVCTERGKVYTSNIEHIIPASAISRVVDFIYFIYDYTRPMISSLRSLLWI